MFGIHAPLAEILDFVPRNKLGHFVVRQKLNLLDFVRRAEAVEEMQHRDFGFQC